MTTPATRPLRLCDVCLQVDDHPRHLLAVDGLPPERQALYDEQQRVGAIRLAGGDTTKLEAAFRDLSDPWTHARHLDCCLQTGCPDGSCDRRMDDPKDPFDGGRTTGPALVGKLEAHVASLGKEG